MLLRNQRLFVTILFSVLIMSFVGGTLKAQEAKYQRKSVSSIGAVLLKTRVSNTVLDMINNRLKFHLVVPRFDYNTISNSAVDNFVVEANKTNLTPHAIAGALEQTVLPGLQRIVSICAAERAKNNIKEEDLASAVVDKLKESGVTSEDVMKVMNSAYLYLPVVTEYKEETKDGDLTASMKGYVLWYKMKISKEGNASIELLSDTAKTFSGIGSGKSSKQYTLKRRTVSGDDFARIIAVNTWAKNLAVEMKNIPDFRLSAAIVNMDGSTAEAKLGFKEGIGLDDGFDVVEQAENEQGDIVLNNLGFYRVAKTADNSADENAVSSFSNYIGHGIERGAILMERPRLGIDVVVKPKFFGLNIPKDDLKLPVTDGWDIYYEGLFTEDATSGFGTDIAFSGNLAKVTGISQFFVNLEGGIGFVNAKFNSDFSDLNLTVPVLYDAYLGVSKKLWFSRMNLEVGAGYGYNGIFISGKGEDAGSISMNSLGVKFDASLNYLLTPDLSFGVNLGYKITSNIIEAKVKDKDGNDLYTMPILNSSTNFSGLSFGINVGYAVPSLPFDPFAFLTKNSIDY